MSQSLDALLKLRDLILNGDLTAGERVSELPLVERLGVSRTPVRLALVKLEHEGLLEALPSGGYVVRAFGYDEIVDAIELRGVLEGTAARLASERLGRRSELDALRACLRQLDAVVHPSSGPQGFSSYVALNERFHRLLLGLAKSSALERAVDHATALPFASPSAFFFAQSELPRPREMLIVAQDQHRTILEAVENREGARAEGLAREHARLARRNLDLARSDRSLLEGVRGAALIRLRDAV